METHLASPAPDKFITVEGLRVRYIEEGSGHPVLMIHGASLGSSADVYRRHLRVFAQSGLRAIAVDLPGYGLSEAGNDLSFEFQIASLPKFIDALGLKKTALMAHSRSGTLAVELALREPKRYSHIVTLATNLLLPSIGNESGGHDVRLAQRLDRRMANTEPTIEDTRKLLLADLFHPELITSDELALRHRNSIGVPFRIFMERANAGETTPSSDSSLSDRIFDLQMPLLMLVGREDRSRALERCELLQNTHPETNVHIVPDCKHLMPWDGEQEIYRRAIPFIKGTE